MSSRKRRVVIYIVSAIITILLFFWVNGFLSPIMYKHFGTTIEATGNPPSYFTQTLTNQTAEYFKRQAQTLGTTASVKPDKFCFMQSYNGGAWSTVPDHLECVVKYSGSVELSPHDSADRLLKLCQFLTAEGLHLAREDQSSCVQSQFIDQYGHYSFTMRKGDVGGDLPRKGIACLSYIETDQFARNYNVGKVTYDLWCKDLAKRVPYDFHMDKSGVGPPA